jgi:hypothetical protein
MRRLPFKCWVFGHDDWVRRAPGLLYLECLECGRETPGWTVAKLVEDAARAERLTVRRACIRTAA